MEDYRFIPDEDCEKKRDSEWTIRALAAINCGGEIIDNNWTCGFSPL